MATFDLYQSVTDQVIKQMETSGKNWTNPFNKKRNALRPYNATTGKNYRGMNSLLLNFTPFESCAFASFKQWQAAGCSVKKGQKSSIVVFFTKLEKEDKQTGKKSVFPMLKYFNVFNADQVDGALAERCRYVTEDDNKNDVETIERVEAWARNTGANIRHSMEPRACYSPMLDVIKMPEKQLFTATATSSATEAYYSTLAHELVHWTGHESRKNRKLLNNFGSKAYAFEELVAELGAAFCCAALGISNEPRVDHAQYLNNWLTVLKQDKKAIFKAASLAREAAEMLTGKAEAEDVTEAA